MEVLFRALVLLMKSIKTSREQVERFKSATCTFELSDREKSPPLCVYIVKMKRKPWGTRLAQSVEHATVDLRVVSLSPALGVEMT